jgi:hypothetical protein
LARDMLTVERDTEFRLELVQAFAAAATAMQPTTQKGSDNA